MTSLGICVPSSCTQEDVLDALFNVSVVNQGSDFKHTSLPISCISEEDKFDFDAGVIAYT